MSEQDLNADFAAGFDAPDTAGITHGAGALAAEPVLVLAQDTAPNEPTREAEAALPSAVAVPEVLALTRDEWAATQARLHDFERFKEQSVRQVDGLAGKYGEINRTVQNLKGAYPTLSQLSHSQQAASPHSDAVAQAVAQAVSPGQAPPTGALDVDQLVQKRAEHLRMEMRQEQLADQHEDWREVVTSPAFEAWRDQQPAPYVQKLMESVSPRVVAEAISAYKQAQQAQQPGPQAVQKPPTRSPNRARLEAAITPQGSPSRSAPAKTEADYFKEGYHS